MTSMTVVWTPGPVRQRTAAPSVEDVLRLPDDAPRVELRDGVMIVVPAPTIGHQIIGKLLWAWFRQHAPESFLAVTAVEVAVGVQDSVKPDVLLLRRPIANDDHYVLPAQVAIAVEVMSPGDRLGKSALYADAGIPHFWRIEQDPLRVFAYDLVDGRYEAAGDAEDELVLSAPFAIALPVRDIAP